MKPNPKYTIAPLAVAALALLPAPSHGALIANGDLETEVTAYGNGSGVAKYNLQQSDGKVYDDTPTDTGRTADEWVWTTLARGFQYDAGGGAGGTGDGAFVTRPNATMNAKARGVLFFAHDGGATTGTQTVALDVFLDDNTSANNTDLRFTVELYAWDAGTNDITLSVGGPTGNGSNWSTTTPTGTVADLINTEITAATTPDATWTSISLGNIDLGTGGYDYYAWRIGVVGQENGLGGEVDDYYAFDNLTVVPEPPSAILLGLGCLALIRRRR